MVCKKPLTTCLRLDVKGHFLLNYLSKQKNIFITNGTAYFEPQWDILKREKYSLCLLVSLSDQTKHSKKMATKTLFKGGSLTTGVNTFKLLASSKKKLSPLLKKQFFILYFQITGLANDGPSSLFEEPSSVIFEEVKYDLHDGSDSWRMSILWTNQTIWFAFFIFTYKKKLASSPILKNC